MNRIVDGSANPVKIDSVRQAFAQAFGTYVDSGRVLVCRDTRSSGPMVQAAVVSGLLSAGCEVIDLGVSPTPTLQLAVRWLGAQGGVSITGGHNPAAWNALKFVRGDGLYLNTTQAEELLDIVHQGEYEKAAWDRIRTSVGEQDAIGHHLDVLAAAFDGTSPAPGWPTPCRPRPRRTTALSPWRRPRARRSPF